MRPLLRSLFLIVPALFAAPIMLSAQQPDTPRDLRRVTVADGVELNYVERGRGVGVVFVHGATSDYSAWGSYLGPFADRYRVVAYSRRYNYPNTNKIQPKHSAAVEADDLAALIKKLDLGRVHIVGHSYGAYSALFLAVKHPELVRTLTLAEAPVRFRGESLNETRAQVVKQARAEFEKGDSEGAIRTIIDLSSRPGTYDKIPEAHRQRLLRNIKELEALVTTGDMYPELDGDAVKRIDAPVLLVSGEKSGPTYKKNDEALKRLLPGKWRQQIIVPNADHGMLFQQPEACRKAILDFLQGK